MKEVSTNQSSSEERANSVSTETVRATVEDQQSVKLSRKEATSIAPKPEHTQTLIGAKSLFINQPDLRATGYQPRIKRGITTSFHKQ
jgi:hypothetical protein